MQCIFFDPRSEDIPKVYINNLFEMWHKVWKDVHFIEKKGTLQKATQSDEFTRQHLIVSIFDDLNPVGMLGFRKINIHNSYDRKDSWLNSYFSEEELNRFTTKENSRFLIASNVTLNPEYRKSKGKHWGLILMQLAFLHAYQMGYDICFGVTDNGRGVDKLAAAAGMEIISRNKLIYGVKMHTVYNSPKIIGKLIPNYEPEAHELFKNTTFYTNTLKEKDQRNDRTIQTGSRKIHKSVP
jgi:hypothetical protein